MVQQQLVEIYNKQDMQSWYNDKLILTALLNVKYTLPTITNFNDDFKKL